MTLYHISTLLVLLLFCFSFAFVSQLFINGEFVDSISGKTFPTVNPATGKKIVDIAEGDKVNSLFLNVPLMHQSLSYIQAIR
jgi:hypothetical protein